MTEMFPGAEREAEKPDIFEFNWPQDEDLPDMRWLRSFAKYGLPEDIRQAYEALKVLKTIEYDGTADQEAARAHVDAAIELFSKSYTDWSDFALAEANRIVVEHLGEIKVEGQDVVGVDLIHEANGKVRLKFLTTSLENSEVLVY